MSEDKTHALLELYKANTLLFEQLAELVQQAGRQWQSESQQAVATALAESEAELKMLLAAKDLPTLLASQTGIVQRRLEKHQAAIQAALQVNAGSPGALAGKLAETFGAWYRHMNEMASTAGPAAGAWSGYPNPFLQYWSQALDDGRATGGRSEK